MDRAEVWNKTGSGTSPGVERTDQASESVGLAQATRSAHQGAYWKAPCVRCERDCLIWDGAIVWIE